MQSNTSPWRLSACACAFLRSYSTVYYTTFSANHIAQLYIFPFSYSRTPCVRKTPRSLHYSQPIDLHSEKSCFSIQFVDTYSIHSSPRNSAEPRGNGEQGTGNREEITIGNTVVLVCVPLFKSLRSLRLNKASASFSRVEACRVIVDSLFYIR